MKHKIYNSRYFYIILLLIIAIFTVSNWYVPGNVYSYGDEYWLADPSAFFKSLLYAWSDRYYSAGWTNFNLAQIFPITVFWVLLKSLSIPNYIIQYIWFVLMLFLPGLSMFFLAEHIIKRSFSKYKHIYLSCFLAALFYSYNLILVQLLPIQPHLKPVMIGAPLFVLFLLKGFQNGGKTKYALLTSLATLLYSQSNVNVAYTVPVLGLSFLMFAFFTFTKRTEVKNYIFFILKVYSFYLLFNLFWIVPLILFNFSSSSAIQSALSSWNSVGERLTLDYFKLIGFWAWDYGTDSYDYYPYHKVYQNIIFLIATFGITISALLGIVFKKNILTKFFFGLLIIGIFLAKGDASPFGFIFRFLFNHFPMFWIFRDPFSKFSIYLLISISSLLSIFAFHILNKIKYGILIYIAVVIGVLLSAYPIFVGSFLHRNNSNELKASYVKIPSYWEEYQDKSITKVLVGYPTSYGSSFNWERGYNGNPFVMNTPSELYKYENTSLSPGETLLKNVYDKVLLHKDPIFEKFIKLFNIEKIAISDDLEIPDYLKSSLHDYYSKNYILVSDSSIKLFEIDDPTSLAFYTNDVIVSNERFNDNWHNLITVFEQVPNPVFYSPKDSFNITSDIKISNRALYVKERDLNELRKDFISLSNTDKVLVNYLVKKEQFPALYTVEVANTFSDKYKLLIKPNEFSENGNAFQNPQFNIIILDSSANEIYNKTHNITNRDGWIELDEIQFAPGNYHLLSYNLETLPTTLLDVSDALYDKEQGTMENGIISANKDDTTFYFKIPNFNSNKKYLVNMDYTLLGGALEFTFLQSDAAPLDNDPFEKGLIRCEPEEIYGIKCDGVVSFSLIPFVNSKSAYLGLRLTTLYRENEIGKIDLKKIEILEVTHPHFTLVSSSNNPNERILADVMLDKINSTKYTGNISGAFSDKLILVFNNSYHPGWELKLNNKKIDSDKHILVNGYANAWVVSPQDIGSGELEISFKYQDYFILSLIISVLSVVVTILYLFMKRKND